MTKKLSFERKSAKSFKNHLMIEVNDVLNNILLEDEDHPSYQLNDAINRFKTEISDVDVKFIKTEKLRNSLKENKKYLGEFAKIAKEEYDLVFESIKKQTAILEGKAEKTFSKIFPDGNYYFSEHDLVYDEKGIKHLIKEKDYFELIDILNYPHDYYADDECPSTIFSTSEIFPNNNSKLELFISLNEDRRGVLTLKDIVFGKQVSFKELYKIIKKSDIENQDCDCCEKSILTTKIVSNAIHIMHGGKFLPVNLSNLSKADRENYTANLVLICKVYEHFVKLCKNETDGNMSPKPIEKYKGITGDHEIFSNYSLLS